MRLTAAVLLVHHCEPPKGKSKSWRPELQILWKRSEVIKKISNQMKGHLDLTDIKSSDGQPAGVVVLRPRGLEIFKKNKEKML